MPPPNLSRLELRILNILWREGDLSIREVQDLFPHQNRPAYTTIQTTIYRMEAKGAVKRVKKIGNAHIFRSVASKTEVVRRLVDEGLSIFGGRMQPVMAHLIDSGSLTLEDIKEAERALREKPSSRGAK